MSTIRLFDSVPHIVRYGMQDEKKGESWMLFYRNAVCFRVSVSRADVEGTSFGAKWLELNKETDARKEGMKKWIERWNELCDCIISQCMPLLEELAPSNRQWKTLEDHLRMPTYELKMVLAAKRDDAVAQVISGPVEKPSYEHHLRPLSDFQSLPDDIPRYHAQDLTVLGQGKPDWRHPPAKVQTSKGDIFYFMSCNKRAKMISTGEISDASLNKINAYARLRVSADGLKTICIPTLLGVVVSGADGEVEDWEVKGNLSPAMSESAVRQPGNPVVAGVLLTYVSKAKRLSDVMKALIDKPNTDDLSSSKERWKTEIHSAVQHLHDQGIAMGGRTDPQNRWSYVNQHTVRLAPVMTAEGSSEIDVASLEGAHAWLMLDATSTMIDVEGQQVEREKFEEQKTLDLEAVGKLFQF